MLDKRRESIEWVWGSTVSEPTSVDMELDDLLTVCEVLDRGGLVAVLGGTDATWFVAHWFARLQPRTQLTVMARGPEPIRSLPSGPTIVLIDAAVGETLDTSEAALASSGLPITPEIEVHAVVSSYGPRRFAAKVVVCGANGTD